MSHEENVERLVARIEGKLDALIQRVDERIRNDDARYERYARVIYGENGKVDAPGLMVRIDRLEQSKARHTWLMRVIIGAVISLTAGGIWTILSG